MKDGMKMSPCAIVQQILSTTRRRAWLANSPSVEGVCNPQQSPSSPVAA